MQRGVVIIGLGNVFLHDDAVGVRVAEALTDVAPNLKASQSVHVEKYEEMDLSILQEMKDASRLIIIDSIKSGTDPGTVSLFQLGERPGELESIPSLHELDLSDMVYLAQTLGMLHCPVLIVGVEPEDLSIGEGLSARVEAAIPRAVTAVLSSLGEQGGRCGE